MNLTKPQPLRIAMLTYSLDEKRGGGRFVSGILEQLLHDARYRVHVMTSLPSGSPHEDACIPPQILQLVRQLPRIRRMLRDADVIHAIDLFPFGFIAVFAGLGLRKNIIITAIGSGSVQPLYRFVLAPISRFVYRHATVVTAISGYVARMISEKVSGVSIRVIIPGIPYGYFADKAVGDVVRPVRPFVLSVAKVKPRKGVDVSVRAFARVAAVRPDIDYYIVGVCEGEYFRQVTALIHELGITERVKFFERISDEELVTLYRTAELFLLLPQNVDNDIEGFGLVFVEAAAFGLPVIGARDSGAEDAVLDGKNGYLVAPTDTEGAAEKMLTILGDTSLRHELAQASIALAKECDWKNKITEYSAVYELLR